MQVMRSSTLVDMIAVTSDICTAPLVEPTRLGYGILTTIVSA